MSAERADLVPARPELSEDFTVDLPEEMHGGFNQETLFELRKYLLMQGPELAWIAQALEAFLRQHQISHAPTLDIARSSRSLTIHSDRGEITLRFDELEPYSLERKLAGQTDPIPNYSDEMRTAVAHLNENAAFRWNLIVKAAQSNKENLPVRPMRASGDFFENPIGIGVFMAEGPGAQTWSALRVVGDDLPLTERERQWIHEASEVTQAWDSQTEAFTTLVMTLEHVISHAHDLDRFEVPDWIRPFRDRIASTLREKGPLHLTNKLSSISYQLRDHKMETMDLYKDVKKFIFQKKSEYGEEHPMECVELPEELLARMEAAKLKLVQILNEALGWLDQNKLLLENLLPQGDSTSVKNARGFLENLADQRKLLT